MALLGRLRKTAPWLLLIVARLLAVRTAKVAGDSAGSGSPASQRSIRLIDATTVRKKATVARETGQLWRIHACLDLPFGGEGERFSAFAVTDEKGGERLERLAVVPGEVRIADRVHCCAEGLAEVIAAGADIVVRAGWQSARWLAADGAPVDLPAVLVGAAESARVDRPIRLARGRAEPLALRLVAIRMPKDKAAEAVLEARREARSKQHTIQPGTLIAAEWVILVTTLAEAECSAEEVLELHRLRWRIEIAFKRLKSLAGLTGPPGECPEVAKAWVLCHLIAALLTEARLGALGDSPRPAPAPAAIPGVSFAS